MLYNSHLDTLIRVVEAGSFRRAADQIGISPSAVLKQISLLEKDLGISVFDRTRKGVSLTEAGESVYQDARYIVQYCIDAGNRARELDEKRANILRVGISPMTPADRFTDFWPGIHRNFPGLELRFNYFDDTRIGIDRAFRTLGQDNDVILGAYDENLLARYDLNVRHLTDLSIGISMSFEHPLAGSREKLTLDELSGQVLQLPSTGHIAVCDEIRRDLMKTHPDITIEDYDEYSLEVFYALQTSDKLAVDFDMWRMGHILCETREVDWDYKIPYGVLYAKESAEKVERILDAK